MSTGLLIALVLMAPFIFCLGEIVITMICAPFIILAEAVKAKCKSKKVVKK